MAAAKPARVVAVVVESGQPLACAGGFASNGGRASPSPGGSAADGLNFGGSSIGGSESSTVGWNTNAWGMGMLSWSFSISAREDEVAARHSSRRKIYLMTYYGMA